MHQFLELIVSNQLIVMALSVVVWIVGKCGWIAKRPALVHVLWLMVLLKCLIPPLINVPIFPSAPQLSFAIETSNPTKAQSSHIGLNSRQLPSDLPNCNANVSEFKASTNGRVPLFADVPYIQDPVRLKSIHIFALLTGSLLGTIFISFHIALRMRMIGRLLKQHVALSERETLVLREVCRQVGVKNAPRLIVVDADVSPMLWGGLSSSTIFLPERLLGKIDDQRLLHILMHEMAHFVRRDHVSNTFAFLAVGLFWWNPALWLIRRQLHLSAEASCDALTLQRIGGARKQYAETLMIVTDYITSSGLDLSAVAISFGESHSLKRRIEMIASSKVKAGLSRFSVVLLTCVAMALPFMPARAQEKKTADATKTSVPDTQIATPIFVETAPPPTAPKVNAQESSSDQEAKFTTSAFGMINRNSKFKLPDYIPAAHGNAVEIIPKHYFMLMPLGSTHKWHVRYIPTNMDEILTIPPMQDLRQGQTFPLQKKADTTIVAFVESDYANDLDIGVRIIDNASGEVKYQCTLLMNVSRYQWVGDSIKEK